MAVILFSNGEFLLYDTFVALKMNRSVRIAAKLQNSDLCKVYFRKICPFFGFELEYLYTAIYDMLHYDILWVKVDSQEEAKLALTSGAADIAGTAFVSETHDDAFLDKTTFMYDGIGFIMKKRSHQPAQTFVLLEAFTYDMWLLISAFSFLSVLIKMISVNMFKRTNSANRITLSKILHVYRSKIVYGCWFVVVSVLLNLYSNYITVSLIKPTKNDLIQFMDLTALGTSIEKKQCRFIGLREIQNDSIFRGYLLNPDMHNKSWATLFRRALFENPPLFVTTRKDIANYVLNNQTCFIGLDWMSKEVFYKTSYCNLKMVSYPDEMQVFGLSFYHNSKDLRTTLPLVLNTEPMKAFGQYLNKKYFAHDHFVDCKQYEVNQKEASMNLENLQTGFYVLFIGLGLASIILIAQLVCSVIQKLVSVHAPL